MSATSRGYEPANSTLVIGCRRARTSPTSVVRVAARSTHPTLRVALAIGLASAIAFAGLAQINLSAQGLYYDEAHQAPASFAYRGTWPLFFARAFVHGKPLMTMSYSGAIKPAVYGLYLRFFDASFTVQSWRWLGILMVAVTFPLFSVLARHHLSSMGLSVFFALMLTDTTILLGTRHDWGPSALALALRLIFLGTWLRGQSAEVVPPRNSFYLGALVGFSIYEKLSNAVLLAPLAIFMSFPARRSLRHWSACLAGGLLGAFPLLYANGMHCLDRGRLLSTSQVGVHSAKSLYGFAHLLREYLALGDGSLVRRFILGDEHGFAVAEAVLLSTALVALLGLEQSGATNRLPAILLTCYLAVVAGLFLLPKSTGTHHWVIGTPFQYLALSMAFSRSDAWPRPRPRLALLGRAALIGVLIVLIGIRTHGLIDLTRALARGSSSPTWDPSLTRLGELAAQRAGKDLFIAGNWGVALQMYCLSNGHPDVVAEVLQWPAFPPLEQSLDLDRYRSFYLVVKMPGALPEPDATQQLINAFEQHPHLREVPAEAELASLARVKIRKFIRATAPAPGLSRVSRESDPRKRL